MSETGRKYVVGLALLLGAGALIGWLYDQLAIGLLIAALLALAWLVRQLLTFEIALDTLDFDAVGPGEGIWQKLLSRFKYERDRANRYKSGQRQLLKEIRKSTNAMPDGAVILDRDNEIVACNRAAKALAGIKRKKDRGQRIDNLVRDPEFNQLIHEGDSARSIEIASPITDGRWINCRIVPYGADQKLLLIRDVTETVKLSKMRRDFVANASHELRSPLTVLTGYLDSLAEDASVPEDLARPVQQMQAQANRMARIVSELLELSSLEGAGKATLQASVDVGAALARAQATYCGESRIPKIDVVIESSAGLLGSQTEIDSLITNLLSNAVRHTPDDGSITLTWRSGDAGADLIVADTGEGIAPEHIPRLTERFFRVDRGRAREDGGVGLGLAIVKHVLSRHDAELSIRSEPGSGSEFRCHFPPERVSVEPPVPIARDSVGR